MTTASNVLKKDLRLPLMGLAAIVLLTFVGGWLIGRSKGGDIRAAAEVPAESTGGEPGKVNAKPTPRADEPALGTSVPVPAANQGSANPATGTVPVAPGSQGTPDRPAASGEPPIGTAESGAAAALNVDTQAIHKRRARRVAPPVLKEDVLPKAAAPKAAVRAPVAAPKAAAPAAAPKAAVPAKKAKSGWHDPFAD
jgi:hypothetical protein